MKKLSSVVWVVLMAIGIVLSVPHTKVQAASPRLSADQVLMRKGQTYTLKLKNEKKVKWSSSKKAVATVKKGKITAKKPGKTTITAKSGKKTYKCTINVTSKKKKTLVIYFSATGHTKSAAKKVAKAAGADIIRLVPKKAYTSADLDYNTDCRANKEQENNAKPAIVTVIKNIKQYKTVYLGYPIWHGKEPGVIRTFLSKTKLTKKTVIPFCTSGGSEITKSVSNIRKMAVGAKIKDGRNLTDASYNEIKDWITKK